MVKQSEHDIDIQLEPAPGDLPAPSSAARSCSARRATSASRAFCSRRCRAASASSVLELLKPPRLSPALGGVPVCRPGPASDSCTGQA